MFDPLSTGYFGLFRGPTKGGVELQDLGPSGGRVAKFPTDTSSEPP